MTLGPTYAYNLGMTSSDIGYFIAAYILGCAVMPLAMGWLSDNMERRKLIAGLSFLSFLIALYISFTPQPGLIAMFALGGLASSIYSISVAYMNDRLVPSQYLSASASLILINGIGAIAGPLTIGAGMQYVSIETFFPVLAVAFLMLGALCVFRSFSGITVDPDDQSDFVVVPYRSGPGILEINEE